MRESTSSASTHHSSSSRRGSHSTTTTTHSSFSVSPDKQQKRKKHHRRSGERPQRHPSVNTEITAASSSSHSTKNNSTIALLGAASKTGTHFLRAAVDAGYNVRAILLVNSKYQRPDETTCSLRDEFCSDSVHWIRTESYTNVSALQRVVRGAKYVVCMMQDAPLVCMTSSTALKTRLSVDTTNSNKRINESGTDLEKKPLLSLLKILYPIMKEEASIKVFLFQASAMATDSHGKTPVLTKLIKTAHVVSNAVGGSIGNNAKLQKNAVLRDLDAAVTELAAHHRKQQNQPRKRAGFNFIVTRPTSFLKDGGPSTKKVFASKSQPGPFPISHVDLAEFSLNALLTKKLYNSCPYVVTDSF